MIALDVARLRRVAGLPAGPPAASPPPDYPDSPDYRPRSDSDNRDSRDIRAGGQENHAPAVAGAGQVAGAATVAVDSPSPDPALALPAAAPPAPGPLVGRAVDAADEADNPPPWSRRYTMRQAGDPAWRCPPPLDFTYAGWPALAAGPLPREAQP